jgi:hypothetical protein
MVISISNQFLSTKLCLATRPAGSINGKAQAVNGFDRSAFRKINVWRQIAREEKRNNYPKRAR